MWDVYLRIYNLCYIDNESQTRILQVYVCKDV